MNFIDYCKLYKPKILNEWDTSKNGELSESISFSTHKKFWFLCSECETHFQASPHDIVQSKFNCCPNCWRKRSGEARRRTSYLKHNLAVAYPQLASEFDIVKNGVTPDKVSFNSNRKYWWTCSNCGFNWEAIVSNRVKGKGCPRCNKKTHTSFPEQAIFYYIKQVYPDAINSDKHLGIELDIFIPSINIAVEYDGGPWHQDIKKDEKKNLICAKSKILLVRIREQGCWAWPQTKYLVCLSAVSGNDEELSETIKRLFFEIRHDLYVPDIDVSRDKKIIQSEYQNAKKNNSVLYRYPDIAKEWDYEKNKPIIPDKVDYGSGDKYWWICSTCGFSYEMSPNSRTCKGSGCPSCAHRAVFTGKTDLKTVRPDLMKEWDFKKNGDLGLDPSSLLPNSEKKAWWHCSKCGNEWIAIIGNRNKGRGCPVCAKNKHKRKVMNIDTGMVFDSLNEAGAYYGKEKNHHINECCQGKKETALGYHWKYLEEINR